MTSIGIGKGADSIVTLDPATMVVTKWFRTPKFDAPQADVQREFEYLQRLSLSLNTQPFLRCPEPLEIDLERGFIRMSFCSGQRIGLLLSSSSNELNAHIDHLARQIALAIEVYTNVFNEPLYDIAKNNILYDLNDRIVSVIDFTVPRDYLHFKGYNDSRSVTAGLIIARTVYDTIRLKHALNQQYPKNVERLCTTLLRELDNEAPLDMRLVDEVHWQLFNVYRGRYRIAPWYLTVGKRLFERRGRKILSSKPIDSGNQDG